MSIDEVNEVTDPPARLKVEASGHGSRKKPLVIVTRKLPDAVETRMRELFDARLNRRRHSR